MITRAISKSTQWEALLKQTLAIFKHHSTKIGRKAYQVIQTSNIRILPFENMTEKHPIMGDRFNEIIMQVHQDQSQWKQDQS